MRYVMLAALLLSGSLASEVAAQTEARQSDETRPSASDGGRVDVEPERQVKEDADPANMKASAETVDGLALVITIDGKVVELDSATLARVPRNLAGADRKVAGDVVRAAAFAGGRLIATTVVPDTVVNALEEGGLVRTERRQLVIVLAADRPIERVDIEAPATNAKESLDVSVAYADICKRDPSGRWCPRARQP